jgi:hypothetical protein
VDANCCFVRHCLVWKLFLAKYKRLGSKTFSTTKLICTEVRSLLLGQNTSLHWTNRGKLSDCLVVKSNQSPHHCSWTYSYVLRSASFPTVNFQGIFYSPRQLRLFGD